MFASFNARALGLDLPAHETIDLAAEAGFPGVDLVVRNIVERGEDPGELRKRLDDRGLCGGAWPLVVHWRGDRERFDRELELLPRLAETAAILGLYRTGTWVLPEAIGRSETVADPTAQRDAVVRWHRERLGPIARILGEHGTRLGLEAIGVESFRTGRGPRFVTRTAELDVLIGEPWDEAPTPGIILDAFHLYAAAEAAGPILARGSDRVVWVHVADLPGPGPWDRGAIRDPERGLPGEHGAVPNPEVLRLLAHHGYDGPVTAEPLGACRSLAGQPPIEAARRVAAAIRRVWPAGIGGAPGVMRS